MISSGCEFSPSLALPPNLTKKRNSAGPRLVGLIFNWGLLGVLTTQLYVYYLNFPKDRKSIKIIVYALYILDWTQTCLATYDAFQWYVWGWGDVEMLYGLYTSFLNVPICSSIIGAAVQIFFAWRIHTFSRSRTAAALIVVLALLQLGGGTAVAWFLHNYPDERTRAPGLKQAVGIRLGGSAVVDIVIAGSMTYYLLRSKEQAIGHMNNVVTRLVRLTVETGTLTAVAATIDLIFFLTVHNGLHQVSGVILGKLYTNTLLVIFNNRMIMANKSLYQPEVLSNLGFDIEGRHTTISTDVQLSSRVPPSFSVTK
ncbi:hypothetical protein BDZ94DRAFT_1315247 [Collybia nuda]|uniref:DUF6534 domain-containing protein n=1 Tax=Collybia nuda TaxID=64659 RepID=A0A9P5XST6_9AGAR|nr:hypothetical protein BDZ94DRAFT_1315247 [Collybia nuda]